MSYISNYLMNYYSLTVVYLTKLDKYLKYTTAYAID